MTTRIRRAGLIIKDRGASAVEYALVVGAVAALIVGIVFGLGGVISGIFQQASFCIANNAQPTSDCTSGVPSD
jgi:pilus assembly protein Flp/PilA